MKERPDKVTIAEAEKMKLAAVGVAVAEAEPAAVAEIPLPADISWDMLNKSRFFILGAALFSGVSAALYPAVVLKTRLQVARTPLSSAGAILRHGGPADFYHGFATSLTGTIPTCNIYMAALEFRDPPSAVPPLGLEPQSLSLPR